MLYFQIQTIIGVEYVTHEHLSTLNSDPMAILVDMMALMVIG